MVELRALTVLSVLIVVCSSPQVASDASDHRYKVGEPVPLYANKVGPFHNPSETYRYFDLPFCKPEKFQPKQKNNALGELLNGDPSWSTPYRLDFRRDKESEVLCRKTLTKEETAQFRSAVENGFHYQMYFDDLPIGGFIGKANKGWPDPSENEYYLFNYIEFEIYYNKDRVIEIHLRTSPFSVVNITEDKNVDVKFMYSVKWEETNTTFEKRMQETNIPIEKMMDMYSQTSSFPRSSEFYWLSIVNSFLTLLLPSGCLARILLRLCNDFVKNSYGDEESTEGQEQAGWKIIHGDVFRLPKYTSLFAACLGSGTQLVTLTVLIFVLALVGVFVPYNRGALLTALVVIYALTSGIAGYTTTSFYCQLEGKNWVRNLLLTGCLFNGPLFLVFCFLNSVATAYGATAALPFGTIAVIVLIWTLVSSPLLVLGGIAGKNGRAEFQAPCRTTKCPREIPPLRWYRRVVPQIGMAGFFPFSTTPVALVGIFESLWGHETYTLYSTLFAAFILLLILTAVTTVLFTYLQLTAEDHQWWWRSFLCGGSTGIYIYAYCMFYYHSCSAMSGFMQTSFFFGYMACICYGCFLMLGTVGFCASLIFVRLVYSCIKCE